MVKLKKDDTLREFVDLDPQPANQDVYNEKKFRQSLKKDELSKSGYSSGESHDLVM